MLVSLYYYYFTENEETFQTGQSLSTNIPCIHYIEKCYNYYTPNMIQYQINFMLEKYQSIIWSNPDKYIKQYNDYISVYFPIISDIIPEYDNIMDQYNNSIFYDTLYKNTDWQLIISEISKETDELWKFEIMMNKPDPYQNRYFAGSRFKLFVKVGDVINLKYFGHPFYNLNTKVTAIDYNTITLKFPGVSIPLEDIMKEFEVNTKDY